MLWQHEALMTLINLSTWEFTRLKARRGWAITSSVWEAWTRNQRDASEWH